MTTLVYDGDCAFCTSSIRVLGRLRLLAGAVIAWQHADLAALGLSQEQCEAEVQWVADDGTISSGHEAFARLLLDNALPWHPLGRLLLVPPFSWLAARVYDFLAANRYRLPGGTPACALPQDQRPTGTSAGPTAAQ
jgi:predicted DCC family thiol-disulfide oxidoreductase YuxK